MLMLLKPAQNIYAVVLYLIGLKGRSEQELQVTDLKGWTVGLSAIFFNRMF